MNLMEWATTRRRKKVTLEAARDDLEACDRCTVVPKWVLVITG
ncbi:hypothetical protein A2U01_0078600 [Trifolium medium]|uniref:Uncharacterized protein n=1 Tax=Trifolium medium TaxID=97028 RepID=A0A392T8I2_9FABA|nr:hypothetical protein [Trifolium medium]